MAEQAHMPGPKRRGRKLRPPEELTPRRNVSLDAEVQKMLVDLAADLAVEFGFTPTLSQTVRYAVRSARAAIAKAEARSDG